MESNVTNINSKRKTGLSTQVLNTGDRNSEKPLQTYADAAVTVMDKIQKYQEQANITPPELTKSELIVKEMRENLRDLANLQARMRFMLIELEDLVK
jgi:hypothetical protein